MRMIKVKASRHILKVDAPGLNSATPATTPNPFLFSPVLLAFFILFYLEIFSFFVVVVVPVVD